MGSSVICVLIATILGLLAMVDGRPLVRNVRTNAEFLRLLHYHRDVTGMGVIVDFYSDGCGPCRQIAPHYKELAKRYKDQVVFAKVDVNYNRETSGAQRIRSMPTFQMYLNGKKKHQFSGGDLQQLQYWAGNFAREFKESNVKITPEALEEFYKEHAPDKATEENIENMFAKAGGKDGGKGHRNLLKALKKKYGATPKVVPRYDPKAKAEDKQSQQQRTPPPSSAQPKKKAEPEKPNLHLASIEDLENELEKRKAEMEAAQEEAEDNEEEGEDDNEGDDANKSFSMWSADPNGLPERLVIIGGGPAGLSAAIYAGRAGLNPVVIAPPGGGQLQGKGVLVENFAGVVDSTGPAIVFEMQKQAAKYGATFHDELVESATLSMETGVPHVLRTNSSEIKTHTLIIATGADSKWLGVEGEEYFRGGGVSACATCDGYLYRDMPVIVIGGGDTAMEEALHLATTSSKVTIIHRGKSFNKASKVLADRVLNHDKIDVRWETTVQSFHGRAETEEERQRDPHSTAQGADETEPEQPILTHVMLKKKGSDELEAFKCDGAFVAIGHDPNTKIFKDQLAMNDVGYITVSKPPTTYTSIQGVFAAGDVSDPHYRQAITSAGSGAMAALDAERWILEKGIKDEKKAAEEDFLKDLMDEIKEDDEKKQQVLEECE